MQVFIDFFMQFLVYFTFCTFKSLYWVKIFSFLRYVLMFLMFLCYQLLMFLGYHKISQHNGASMVMHIYAALIHASVKGN